MVLNYEEWTLDEALLNAIEVWGDSRTAFWNETDAKGRMIIGALDAFAQNVLQAAETLSGASDPSFIAGALQSFGKKDLVLEPIEHRIAFQLSTGVREKAERCVQLATLVLGASPAEQVVKYLQRVSRCYIAGFEPEVVVMCRAVMENGLSDAFDKKGSPMPVATMRKRLDAAVDKGILTDAGRRAGWTIWQRGNKAVHHDPGVTKDVWGTIKMTLEFLEEVYPVG